ncbi:uncharacterized protein B0H64DRAFT_454153 [Chaetomium fimeti]|uniref:N-acetyltransferase domain-containing protein n=1 Tax=Chaetomium fimeti TaxID=1854472 RepID=A0AAE0LVC0_9PEZI|nr:hypothetical protein B0H64DRAFT_454153 [Chaetomium fimeti]
MSNINFRLANKGDLEKLIEISNRPSNIKEGSTVSYLLEDRTQHPDTIPAAWEGTILDFIYSAGGWYTSVVAEVEETREVVGYCVWEWFEYDEKGKQVMESRRPAKLQAIWDGMGAEEPTHRPPRTYGPEAYQDGLLQARWDTATKEQYEVIHEAFYALAGLTKLSQFWQIRHVAVDPRPEHRDVAEKLVRWGVDIAAKEALWVVVPCYGGEKDLYDRLGFTSRAYFTGIAAPDDKVLNQEWLQKDPRKPAERQPPEPAAPHFAVWG